VHGAGDVLEARMFHGVIEFTAVPAPFPWLCNATIVALLLLALRMYCRMQLTCAGSSRWHPCFVLASEGWWLLSIR
jgi:hypothetical protein